MGVRLHVGMFACAMALCGAIVGGSSRRPNQVNKALWDAVIDGDARAVNQALDEGADANYSRGDSRVIHLTAYCGNVEIVRALLRKGADVHAKANNHPGYQAQLPLSIAARRGKINVMKELLRGGAQLDVVEEGKRSVFCHAFAAGRCAMAEYLLRVSEWDAEPSDVQQFLLPQWLVMAIGTRDIRATVGVDSAPLSERLATVQLLLGLGAEVACEAENDCCNPCPLMNLLHYGKIVWRSIKGQEQFARYMEDVLALLMRAGADPAKKCYCLSIPYAPGRSQPESALEYVLNKSYDSSNAATVMALRGVPLSDALWEQHPRLRPYAATYVRAATAWLDQQCPVDDAQRLILETLAGTKDMGQWLGLHRRARLIDGIKGARSVLAQ